MASLPPISTLLSWAKDGNEPVHHAANAAGKPQAPELPAPVTNSLIDKALKELPQGSAFALNSCLNAYKVLARSTFAPSRAIRIVGKQSARNPCGQILA
jgi:hypothetical protein